MNFRAAVALTPVLSRPGVAAARNPIINFNKLLT
ncbi:hypothetical protein KY5_6537c [Streptomyces formicae]|uniref:Uncharacterized protein n=1 Tax=Streptomyces formicae TaxID=1616117 RepID=A0A291QJD2_9ACTN|nr:hypothetical protein KY5_6537c [Streptomyces formicae]